MPTDLSQIPARFNRLIVFAFSLSPLLVLAAAWMFKLTDSDTLRAVFTAGWYPVFLLSMVLWAGRICRGFIDPVRAWLATADNHDAAPLPLRRSVARFPRDFWGMFVLMAIAAPAVYLWSAGSLNMQAMAPFALLSLAVTLLVGMPAYLIAVNRLGRLSTFLGLYRVQVSLKSKLMLVAGLAPLLAYTLLLHFHWVTTGTLELPAVALWGSLALISLLGTAISIRGMSASLAPVQEALRRSGATTRAELAELKPVSSDEIGYLTQMLGKLFRRLDVQESHVRAVVDTAAEGIIVVDDQGMIDTFNPAAGRLFGYSAQEIRGRPLAWLLPDIVTPRGIPRCELGEQEVEGVHRRGMPIPMSVRVSEMEIGGRRMYTCLVADISERKVAEALQQQAEKRYRDLVETAHDLVWSVDPEGRWNYVNNASRSIYGYEPEEMIGRSIREFHAPEYAESDAEALADILLGKELVQYETVHLDRQGRPHHLSFSAKAHCAPDGRIEKISGTARDISDKKAFEQRLSYQAEHDSLTGLYNRHYFQQELERVVTRASRGAGSYALLYIDLDQFKYINDTLGHAAGDRLLIEISRLLSDNVRGSDLLARFGGDEFTVLLYDINPQNVLQTAEHFRELFDQYRFFEAGNAYNITCSIGAATIDANIKTADEALAHADIACNMAKVHGRNCANLYNPADRDKAGMAEDMGWAARVRDMLERDRFQLVYQPIVAVADQRVQEYEVLIRMLVDDGQVILPGGFMPAAERFGLIHGVDRWVVRKSIEQIAGLRDTGTHVSFSINLSGRAFEDSSLLPLIRAMLDETNIDPQRLTFEITETAAIANLAAATRFIGDLKQIGCQFALDDFGSGFCSFTYLKHLPVDKLKIDGSFVQGLASTPVDQAMVQSMNQVAHALGKRTIAEHVENARTLELLRQYGVDGAQGNFLGEPRERIQTSTRPTLVVGARQG